MLVIGIDPGGVYTGVAMHDGTSFVRWFECKDPLLAFREIDRANHDNLVVAVVIEDFRGSGRLNKYRKKTIEVLGFIFNGCRYLGITCYRVSQQRRLAYVSEVPPEIKGKDERAAAAHVLAHLARLTPCSR
jgi:hypothetical protein